MNQPPESFVRVDEPRLLAFTTEAFRCAGCDDEHAELIARLLANNDLRGVRSHGTRSANGYCTAFESGSLNARPALRTLHETDAAVIIDGDGTAGYLPAVRAAEAAVAKARRLGIGVGLTRHIGHYGSAGHYTRICLQAGCVGFSVQGYRHEADARLKSPRPMAAFSGDPPISFAFPSAEETSIVLDGGASVFGTYHGDGFEDLPERIPATFFKSMGFIATATLIGGALTGFTAPDSDAVEKRWPGALMGGTVIALDPARLGGAELFAAEVDRYVRDLRGTHDPLPGTDQVRVPGQLEEERAEAYRRDGIAYGEPEQASLRALAERLSLRLPWDEV